MRNQENTEQITQKKKKSSLSGLIKIFLISLLALFFCAAFLVLTAPGRRIITHVATEYAYSKLDFQGVEEEEIKNEKGEIITSNINPEVMTEEFNAARHEDGVINILLLGVEAIGYGQKGGHTDTIMIATMNTNTGSLKLTSLLRDTWVTIPGYGEQRINTAYAKGGVEALYETIAQNYDLQLDGYALVGFDAFEKIIDTLGGVEIELTAEEAQYLNTTNYISNKAYRNVVPGKQRLNGNQALGYCRIRKVATLDGSNYDMGRTSRHRRVINAAFSELKTDAVSDLVNLVNNVLPLIETDIRKSNCRQYLQDVIEIGLQDLTLETLRLPEDGDYDSTKIKGNAVLVPHWEDTIRTLHTFIFEDAQTTGE